MRLKHTQFVKEVQSALQVKRIDGFPVHNTKVVLRGESINGATNVLPMDALKEQERLALSIQGHVLRPKAKVNQHTHRADIAHAHLLDQTAPQRINMRGRQLELAVDENVSVKHARTYTHVSHSIFEDS